MSNPYQPYTPAQQAPSGVSPKFSMWLNFAIAILAGIAGGAIDLTSILPQGTAHTIISWSAFIVSILSTLNGVLHGISAKQEGPILKKLGGR